MNGGRIDHGTRSPRDAGRGRAGTPERRVADRPDHGGAARDPVPPGVGAGPPGAYNIAGDGVLTGADVAREFGLTPVPIPGAPVQAAARALAGLPTPPGLPPATEWVEALSHPAIMDASKARRELGWSPRYTGLEALRATLRRERS